MQPKVRSPHTCMSRNMKLLPKARAAPPISSPFSQAHQMIEDRKQEEESKNNFSGSPIVVQCQAGCVQRSLH